MKRLLFFIAVMIAISISSFGQIAYRDAGILMRYLNTKNELSKDNFVTSTEKELKEELADYNNINKRLSDTEKKEIEEKSKKINDTLIYFETQRGDTIWSILELYFPGIIESTTNDEINKRLHENPFFINITYSGEPKGDSKKNIVSLSSISSIGATDVTNFSQGVSLFLIERAKQELTIAFFQRFKNFIDRYPEVKTLFPNTFNTLGNLLAYQYTQMLPVLQEAFHNDMDKLPQNFVEVLISDKYYEKLKDFPEFLLVLNSITLMQQINQVNPPQLIDLLPGITKNINSPQEIENLHSSLQLTSIFSNAIRTDSTNYKDDLKNYWISPNEFYNNILSKPIALNIFLGLIYQRILTEKITYNGNSLATQIKNNDHEILWYRIQLTKLLTQVDNITNAAKNVKKLKDNDSKLTNQDIYAFTSTTIDLFEFGFDIASHYNTELKTEKFKKYIGLAKNANSLYINSVSQKYASAVSNMIYILDTISNEIKSNDTFYKNSIFYTKLIDGVTTYGTFIANMADADTPEEVQKAIEAAALPVGSSSFKKNHSNNIALNGYLGANLGNWTNNKSSNTTWNGNSRLTAPIGIAWTPFPLGNRGAITFFVPLLDVGAIVDYQLKSDSTGQQIDQKIYLKNILSPGYYLVYGLPWNLPISVGFGRQYGPGLIKLGDNLSNPGWKWNFFIGVDIPIFNLNKGRGITK